MDTRSPLDGIFNIIGGLPKEHDKPVKHAVYNAVALFLLIVSCAAGWAVFLILQPFIKPLMWALLVGSVLHPLKRSLKAKLELWFSSLEETRTPVVFGIILLPVNVVNNVSEFIGSSLRKHYKIILGICVAVPSLHVVYYYTPTLISATIWMVFYLVYEAIYLIIQFFTTSLVLLALIAYLTLLICVWNLENRQKFHYASIGVWLLLTCYVSSFFGSFQVLVFFLLQLISIVGFIIEIWHIQEELLTKNLNVTFFDALLYSHGENVELIPKDEDESFNESIDTPKSPSSDNGIQTLTADTKDPLELRLEAKKSIVLKPKIDKRLQRSMTQPYLFPKRNTSLLSLKRGLYLSRSNSSQNMTEKYETSVYLYTTLWACVVMLFWKNVILLPLLPIPILLYVIKHIGIYFGIWQLIYDHLNAFWSLITDFCNDRIDALVPVSIRGVYKIGQTFNGIVKRSVQESIDTLTSCVVITALIVFVICGSIFIFVQIYAEGIMLVQMTSNLINQTVVHNPELRQLLPPGWDETVDSFLDNAYVYGREGISKGVKGMMANVDPHKAEKLEKQILELWDRFYQSWMSSDSETGPKVTSEAVQSSWQAFITDLQKSQDLLNLSGLMDFAKQNVGTLMSLLESIWGIVKGNIGLIIGSFTAFLSIILDGGTAVLNFLINTVVFLTTLFYLLSSSGDLYKPVELMTNFSRSGSRFGHALEGAVNGVFTASFKMAAFYGMWTWLIHNLFNVKIVYLPSAFATILGAIPFLGTYWACVPAVLDLWLAQERGFEAILIAIFQFIPTYVVDTEIYREIKGGHPYLTGLAIAGGLFCLGVEGAIIGPILLCGLYVAIDLSSSIFKESPLDEINILHQLQNTN